MIGKKRFAESLRQVTFDPKSPHQKLLFEVSSVEYCEIQAKILISEAMDIRLKQLGNDSYSYQINEAIRLLVFAKEKEKEKQIGASKAQSQT
jgi:hypothetical protein